MVKTPALAQLKDIQIPQSIGVWPLAGGWWILIIIASVMSLCLFWWVWQRYRRNRAKKRALVLLNQFKRSQTYRNDAAATASYLSALLRRVAIAYYPRHEVAGLSGNQWLEFLDKHAKKPLFAPIRELLITLPYQREVNCDVTPLFDACEHWIKQRGVKSC